MSDGASNTASNLRALPSDRGSANAPAAPELKASEAVGLDILVVDDEDDLRLGIACELAEAGHRVTEANDGQKAMRLIAAQTFDVVITDVRLPHVDGLTLLGELRRSCPDTTVIVMTAYGRVADATLALRAGAHDYVTKPFDMQDFPVKTVARIAEQRGVDAERLAAREQLEREHAPDETIVGRSRAMNLLMSRIDTLAQSDAPVLITGESGTGKEMVARALHRRSARRAHAFVAVNCAALPETLIEAELFGHERGAFTGAARRREGRFRAADGGTLLLDEIGELAPNVQTKLLRVLQEGVIEPLGSNVPVAVNVRVVSATHEDLKDLIAKGRFREDLYYRLNVLDVAVPALRDRMEDLPLLVEHFLGRFLPPGAAPPSITAEAWARLRHHSFPGNVRELSHLIERAVVLARGGAIGVEHLPVELQGAGPPPAVSAIRPLHEATAEFERRCLVEALRATRGHRARAAQLLGISRKTLWEKMRAQGIKDEELSGVTGAASGEGGDEQD